MSDVYLLMDERAMDPDQFGDAIVYSVAESLEAARRDQTESGCGVIIRASLHGDVLRWEEYIPAGRAAVAAPATCGTRGSTPQARGGGIGGVK